MIFFLSPFLRLLACQGQKKRSQSKLATPSVVGFHCTTSPVAKPSFGGVDSQQAYAAKKTPAVTEQTLLGPCLIPPPRGVPEILVGQCVLRSVTSSAAIGIVPSRLLTIVAPGSNLLSSVRSEEDDPQQRADRISEAGDPVRKQMPINHRRTGALFHSLLTSRDQHTAFSCKPPCRSLCISRKRARCPNYVNLFFVRLT